MLTAPAPAPTPASTEEEWDLDMRVIEASYPIPTLACDTSDNCGASCSSSCATKAADPA